MIETNKCQFCDYPVTLADAAFCVNCGATLSNESQPSAIADRLKLLGGEIRLLSVFFINFVGLDALLATPAYHQVMMTIRGYINDIEKIIRDFDGTVQTIVPDSRILAIFGAPRAHPDDNRRTIDCVLAIRQWWREVKKGNALLENIDLAIGINTGRAFFGYLLEKYSFLTVIGDTINTASRITDLCPAGEILISESTKEQVEDFIQFRHLGERSVKGKAARINIYLIQERRERKEAPLPRFPIFGREEEVQRLLAMACRVRSQGLVFSIISGQMGIGKSRLKEEFEDRLSGDPAFQWIETHCSSEIQIPFFPYKLLLQKYLGLSDFDSVDKIRTRIDEYTRQNSLSGNETEGLRHLLTANLRRLHSDELKSVNEEIFTACKTVIRTAARHKPLILIFEEFNRADRMSRDLTSYLISELKSDPVMLLMINVSPEYLANINLAIEEIKLAPLSVSDIGRLVLHILQDSEERVIDYIFRVAGGNPLFTIETIRNTQRSQIIKEIDGRWTLEKEPKLPFLNDLYSLIMSTLDSLPLDYRLVVDYASVIGYSFNRRIINGLLKHPRLDEQLQYLVHEGYFVITNDGPDPQYGFRHNLLKDAAYTVLPLKKRKEIHQQTAFLYEDIYQDQLASYYEDIGYHYLTCENLKKAADFYLLAGNKAKNLYAFDQALSFYDTVLKIQAQAGQFVTDDVYREVLLNQADVFEVTGDIAKMERASRRGLELCRRGTDPERAPLFGERCGLALLLLNRLTEAEETLLSALEQSRERPALSALLYSHLGELYTHTFEYERSILNHNLAWNTARGHNLREGEIICLLNLAALHQSLGNYEQALEYLTYGLDHLIPKNDLRHSVRFKCLAGEVLLEIGHQNQGRAFLEETAETAHQAGILEPFVRAAAALALLDVRNGKPDQALSRLAAIDQRLSFFIRENLLLEVTTKKAYVYFYLGDPRGPELATAVLRNAEKMHRRDYEFNGRWLLAHFQTDQTLEHARTALEIAESIKLPPLIARGLHLMAHVYRQLNDREHAMLYGMKALHIYDELKLKLSETNALAYSRRPEYVELLET